MRIFSAATLLVLATRSWAAPTSLERQTNVLLLDSFYNSDNSQAQIRVHSYVNVSFQKQALNTFSSRLPLFGTKPIDASVTVVVGDQEVGIQSSGLTSKTVSMHLQSQSDQDVLMKVRGHSNAEATLYLSHGEYVVISDIDDTIKDSEVLNKLKVAVKTLWLNPKPVKLMPALYEAISTQLGKPLFVYISGSPLPFYPFLRNFIANWYPKTRGPMILQPKPPAGWTTADLGAHKRNSIAEVARFYPSKKLILVGDSGQMDPEIYAQAYRDYTGRVVCIIIRKVPHKKADHTDTRFEKALGLVPKDHYVLVEDSQLAGLIKAVNEQGVQERCPVLSEPASVATLSRKRGANK